MPNFIEIVGVTRKFSKKLVDLTRNDPESEFMRSAAAQEQTNRGSSDIVNSNSTDHSRDINQIPSDIAKTNPSKTPLF